MLFEVSAPVVRVHEIRDGVSGQLRHIVCVNHVEPRTVHLSSNPSFETNFTQAGSASMMAWSRRSLRLMFRWLPRKSSSISSGGRPAN